MQLQHHKKIIPLDEIQSFQIFYTIETMHSIKEALKLVLIFQLMDGTVRSHCKKGVFKKFQTTNKSWSKTRIGVAWTA